MSKRKIGADEWLSGNPYNKDKGLKEWKKTEKKRPKTMKKHHKERMANGYSWFDWINFDSYIAGIVATAVLKFAEDGVGYFPIWGEQMIVDDEKGIYEYPDGTHENHTATCGAIYFALTNWLDWDLVKAVESAPSPQDAYAMELVVMEEATEAMVLFAENLCRWWD